jgi:hypothetical protein
VTARDVTCEGALLLVEVAIGEAVPSSSSCDLLTAERVDRVVGMVREMGVALAPLRVFRAEPAV